MEDNIKHNGYGNPCHITIHKHPNGFYTLAYPDEGYEYYCSEGELLEEIREHLDLMKGE